MSRLGRDSLVLGRLQILLASHGISLITADTGQNITETTLKDPMAKAIIQMQGIFAELDKSLLVKKLRKAREQKRMETGKCEGRKGYKDEQHIETLRLIRNLRRKPRSGKKRLTFNEVASKLNDMGVKTITGNQFNGNMIRGIVHRAKA